MKANTLFLFCLLCFPALAQQGSLHGVVHDGQSPVPFANILLQGTDSGAFSGEDGRFQLAGIPPGAYQAVVSAIGYRPLKVAFTVSEGGDPLNLGRLELKEDVMGLEAVVVTGTRTNRYRKDLPVAVNVMTAEAFDAAQAVCLADGLSYQPGLRTETDCQTCNYTQVRMNGLGGSYSQILINSRPIFSALNGLYGLEQIPASMISRVEVVRGGGSVLYGSSAIAGTINIITRDPRKDTYSLSANHALIGESAHDNLLNFNISQLSEDRDAGLSFFASRRQRQEFDANNDGFSELPRLLNHSFGLKSFLRPRDELRLELSLNSITEERNGGDLLDNPPHQRTQSEQRSTHIFSGDIGLDWTINGHSSLMAYGGAQHTRRTHYTGLFGQDGYGNTRNHTLQAGLQYNHTLSVFPAGSNTFTLGAEFQLDDVMDEIPAYNFLVDQITQQWGFFLQSDWKVGEKLTLLAGGRINVHNLMDRAVFTPRFSAMYAFLPDLKLRASYARGFRAPQAFDTDLHIAFAGGGVATIQISPGLKPEYSDSYSASLDFDRPGEHAIYGFTLSGFHTRLYDAFVLEEQATDADGNLQLSRRNGGHSTVAGLTLEGRANLDNWVEASAGFTFQRSTFDDPVAWSADIPGSRRYLRTPDQYGFYSLSFLNGKDINIFLTGIYTGPMLAPHFGGAPGVDGDRLEVTPHFWETNLKLSYTFRLPRLQQSLQLSAGVQNIFNAYQSDFDTGPNRDSNYIYGPARPRTYFMGLKWGGE